MVKKALFLLFVCYVLVIRAGTNIELNRMYNSNFEINNCGEITTTISCVINGTTGVNEIPGTKINGWHIEGPGKLIRMPNSLPIFIKDFLPTHPDFDFGSALKPATQAQLVKMMLANGLPVLTNPSSGNGNIESQTSFNEWYSNDATSGTPIDTLSLIMQGGGLNFESTTFYPLSGIGFQDTGPEGNSYFTLYFQANFTFADALERQNAFFQFGSSDDLWVFIDGKIYSDIGGVHDFTFTAATGVDSALELNKPHTLDVFFAQRSLRGSGISLKSNVQLKPTKKERLGVFLPSGSKLSTNIYIPGYDTCQIQVHVTSADTSPAYQSLTLSLVRSVNDLEVASRTLDTAKADNPSSLSPQVWLVPQLQFPEVGDYDVVLTSYADLVIYGVELHCSESPDCLGDPEIETFSYARSAFAGKVGSYYNLLKSEMIEINGRVGKNTRRGKPALSEVGMIVEKSNIIQWKLDQEYPSVDGKTITDHKHSLEISPNNYVATRKIKDPRKGHNGELTYLFVFNEDFIVMVRKVEEAEEGARFDLHVRALATHEFLDLKLRKDIVAEGLLLDNNLNSKDTKQAENMTNKYKVSSLIPESLLVSNNKYPAKFVNILDEKISLELELSEKKFTTEN